MIWRTRVLGLLGACLPFAGVIAQEGLSVTSTTDAVEVRDGKTPVLRYQKTMIAESARYARADYVHPLYDLEGRVLSEDFPQDHQHHRGIFWAWHQVLIGKKHIGDAWVCNRFLWDVQSAVGEVKGDRAEVRTTTLWRSPDWVVEGKRPPFLRQKLRIVVRGRQPAYRVVDFHLDLESLVDGLAIGGSDNVKGYGGFSTRIRLPEDLEFVGSRGSLVPQTTAVKGGKWLNMLGTLNGKSRGGLAVICRPRFPGGEQKWILRSKRSMQNPQFPGRSPRAIPQGQPLRLKYRLVVHDGSLGADELNRLHAAFQAEK